MIDENVETKEVETTETQVASGEESQTDKKTEQDEETDKGEEESSEEQTSQETEETGEEKTEEEVEDEDPLDFDKVLEEKFKTKFDDAEKKGKALNKYVKELVNENQRLVEYEKRNTEANEKLYDILMANDQLKGIIEHMIQGADFHEALARNVDVESLPATEEDPDYDKWEKNKKARLKEKKAREEFNRMIEDNTKFTQQSVKSFVTDNKLDKKETEGFLTRVEQIRQGILMDKISKEDLDFLFKAYKYDRDLTNKTKLDDLKKKNSEIIQQITKDKTKGDGLPNLNAGQKKAEKKKDEPSYVHRTIDAWKKVNNKNGLQL